MSNIKRDCSAESETSTSFDSAEDRAPAKLLKKKLNEVLHEGIFDSILPYLLPKQHLLQENSYSAAKKLSNSNGNVRIVGERQKSH